MNQCQWPANQRSVRAQLTNERTALVNGLYLCGSKFLAHLCINPNHNNKSKGHFKLDITTVLFRKLRSITHTLNTGKLRGLSLNLPTKVKLLCSTHYYRYSILLNSIEYN